MTTWVKNWKPYLYGALSGLVLVFSVGISGEYFGTTTSLSRSSGMLEAVFAPEKVESMPYFIEKTPTIDWQWMFVLGILLGAWVSAKISREFRWKFLPQLWENRLGQSKTKRALFAFLGGSIGMFGARLAGGCPSGHGLSGLSQLAVSGFIALACFLLGGMLVTGGLYRGGRNP